MPPKEHRPETGKFDMVEMKEKDLHKMRRARGTV